MKFGRSAAEAAEEPSRTGSGDFIRYLKDGDTTFRILQEPDEWTYYWEHFSPAGFSFPCPRAKDDPIEDCPGCSSNNDKMKKVSRKIAFNVLASFNGQEYVNPFKIGPMVADKLENRFKRFGTVTDRDYTITKYKTGADRWDFDVEGSQPTPIDPSRYELKNIEEYLQMAWDDAWGDPKQAEANRMAADEAPQEPQEAPARRLAIAPTPAPAPVQSEEPPFEEKVYREGDLRAMDHAELLVLIKAEMELIPPSTLTTTDAVVDWMMALQS